MRRRGARADDGAAAVEAALVLSFFLVPLLLGVLYWGQYFWKAQAADELSPRIPSGAIVGKFTCDELVARVKDTVVGILPGTTESLGLDPVSDITVRVVEVLPTVGAIVTVSVSVPLVDQVASFLPLPNEGRLVSEFTIRLDNVVVTTEVCA